VLLTSFTYNDRKSLRILLDNLEQVGNSSEHLVYAALDTKAYEWGVLQGIPVFSPRCEHHFGPVNEAILKSCATWEILEAGYSVVYGDHDMRWFQDPFNAFHQYMNEERSLTIPWAASYPRTPERHVKLDGLYIAPHSQLMLLAFADVVSSAREKGNPKQPSIHHILCSGQPSDACEYLPKRFVPTASSRFLHVRTLDCPS